MPKTEISEYDETDALNTDISGIVLSDATLIDQIDNIARAQMGALKRWFKSSLFRLRDSTDQTKLLALDLSGLTTATTRTLVIPDKNGMLALTSDTTNPQNLALAATVAANALTISLKGADGNDPSATNVVNVLFRNAALATGTPVNIAVSAATSLVISSGSTMGFTSATAGRLWIGSFNDAGTFRLGAVNVLSGTSIMALRDGVYSSTAEGGAGAADSAQVIYTGTAVTAKALAILGYMEWSAGLTTAGTWAIVPTGIQLLTNGDAKPGDIIQTRRTDTGAVATGSTTIPFDDTIPQITEGDQYMTQSITPVSSANLLAVSGEANLGNSVSNFTIAAIFRDAIANALAVSKNYVATAGADSTGILSVAQLAGATSASTFRLRAGPNAAATLTFNGSAGGRLFGGTMNSYLQVQEIMA